MRALVTGAAGFIGARLSAALLEQGADVVGVDCFTPYYERGEKDEHLAPLRHAAGFRFRSFDLATHDNLACWLEEHRIDTVFHLAGQPGVRASWGPGFADYSHHNVTATANLLEAAADYGGIRSFVFASSSSVYGNNAGMHALSEDAELAPLSPYGITKMTCEHLARTYWQLRQVRTVGLRYFTVYGPGQRPDMAFRNFITRIRNGIKLEVYGDGHQSRSFTFVDDAVAGTIAAAERGHPGTVYNIGAAAGVSLLEAIELLAQIHSDAGGAPFPVNIQGGAMPIGDARHTLPDLSRTRRDLEWSPTWTLRDGLRRQYAWQFEARR